MHGFEDRGVGANVGAGRHSQSPDQSGHQIGENVAEQIGGHQDVELPGVEHELHRAGVDDDRFQFKAAFILAFVQLQGGLQKNTGQGLHDVGFVHDRDFFPPGCNGMRKRKFQQAPAALSRVDSRRHGHSMRVVVDLDVVLVPDVQTLEIFAHHHQIDVVESAARNQRARGAQIGIQLELFAQTNIRRSIAAARRSLERPLERQPRARDAVDRCARQRISGGFHAFQAGRLPIPLKWRAQSLQRGERRIHDLGSDPVSGDQGGGNRL